MSARHAPGLFVADLQGGGAMGVLQVEKLRHLENLTGQPLSGLFDAFYCASVGAILGAGLLVPDPEDPSKPRYSAKALADIFHEYLPQYLPYDPWHYPKQAVKALFRRTDLHYDRSVMEKTLPLLMGDVKMTDLVGNIVVPSGIIHPGTARPYHFVNFQDRTLPASLISESYFSSPEKKERRQKEMEQTPVATAILCTSACPTVFPSYFNAVTKTHHVDMAGVASPLSLVQAFARAASRFGREGQHPQLSFVQFGTAKNFRTLDPEQYDNLSFLGLLTGPVLDLTSLNVHLSDIEQIENLCGPDHVYILDREWDERRQGPRDILNTRPKRIKALVNYAWEEISEQEDLYQRLADALVENRAARDQQAMAPDGSYLPSSDPVSPKPERPVRFICVPVSPEDESVGQICIELPGSQIPRPGGQALAPTAA